MVCAREDVVVRPIVHRFSVHCGLGPPEVSEFETLDDVVGPHLDAVHSNSTTSRDGAKISAAETASATL